jgi:hypothetical protein
VQRCVSEIYGEVNGNQSNLSIRRATGYHWCKTKRTLKCTVPGSLLTSSYVVRVSLLFTVITRTSSMICDVRVFPTATNFHLQ